MLTREYVRSSGYLTDFCVVFDGQDRYRSLERMYVPRDAKHAFSRTGEGDEKIIETVRQYASKPGVRVVVASNDNYVRNNARGHGASLMPSNEIGGKKSAGLKGTQKGKETGNGKKLSARAIKKINREYMEELGL